MICEVSPFEQFIAELQPAFMPRALINSWDWIQENGRMQDGAEFNGDRIPWCKGVCDAWDDPETREIILPWGTRLGKTTIALQLMAKSAAVQPRPGLFTSSTETLAMRTVENKVYPILAAIRETRRQLPSNRKFWTKKEIRLSSSKWAVAWSGSDSTLADLSAFYGWANEVDKWNLDERLGGEAGEGDPLDQFYERFKEFQDAKILLECSPSTKLRSRIEKKYQESNRCTFQVPCPKCGGRQPLKLGAEDPMLGGILFDKLPDGTLDAPLALESARYVCARCRYEIHDDQRPAMMRAGVWVPEGCQIDKRGRVRGTPARSARIWGGRLSSLYSLQLRWGDIAEKFVKSRGNSQSLRMFVNGWLAETWEPFKSKSEPEDIGARLATEVPRGVIPAWATWLFAGIDVQADHFVYAIVACGPGERTAIVDDGTLSSWDEIEEQVIARKFEHEGGGELEPAVTGIDSGHKTRDCYVFCKRMRRKGYTVNACKGANNDCAGEPFVEKIIGQKLKGKKEQNSRSKEYLVRAGRGLRLIRVSPYYFEPIIQEQLEYKNPGEACSLELNAEAATDVGLLRELCNGAESAEPSRQDPDRHLWVKRWDNEPNDKRDCYKYARCMMEWKFNKDWKRAEKLQPPRTAGGRTYPVADETKTAGMRKRFRPQLSSRRSRR